MFLLINEWNCIKTRHRLFASHLMKKNYNAAKLSFDLLIRKYYIVIKGGVPKDVGKFQICLKTTCTHKNEFRKKRR